MGMVAQLRLFFGLGASFFTHDCQIFLNKNQQIYPCLYLCKERGSSPQKSADHMTGKGDIKKEQN